MAANAAAAIARLGGDAHFWGPAGDDALADAMANELAAFGVDVRGLHRVPDSRSSHSAILVDEHGERLIIGVRGVVLTADDAWLPIAAMDSADAVLADVRWPIGAKRALLAARERNVPSVLDADVADRAVLHQLVALADYVVFSEPGLEAFAGHRAARGLADALGRHTRVAAVTRGAQGVDWVDAAMRTRTEHLPAMRIARAVDTTGAGDVFHGAFTLAIAERSTPVEALRFASVAAALKCEREGARSVPTRAEVEHALKEMRG